MTDQIIDPRGKTLSKIFISDDESVLWAVFNDCALRFVALGDCCAYSFFTDLEIASDLPAEVTAWDSENGEAPIEPDGEPWKDEVRDTQFIKIRTTKGYIDLTMHTDHNGYYGGWWSLSDVYEYNCSHCGSSEMIICDGEYGCGGCGAMFSDLDQFIKSIGPVRDQYETRPFKFISGADINGMYTT
jgi:hypothetical protein